MSNQIRRQNLGLGKTAAGGSGGSYAAHERSAAGAPPPVTQKHWGDTGVTEGSRTPWGEAEQVIQSAPGISFAHTSGHGGVKLSPERNREIPAALRNRNGWYEEDCEANIPQYFFADDMAGDFSHRDPDRLREVAADGIREWYPDEWTRATGEQVELHQSRKLREREMDRQSHDQFAFTNIRDSASDPSKVVISAKREADGAEAEFLVDRDEYKAHDRSASNFTVDPERHPELPPKQEEVKPTNTPVVIPDRLPDSITGAARTRINKDLDQLWRSSDGSVRSLHQILESDGATGRSVYVEGEGANIKFRYAIVQADRSSYRVSKATFDFLDTIPDGRTPADLQREDSLRKEAKLRKVETQHQHSRNLAEAHRAIAPARAALLESQEKYLALRKEQDEKEKVSRGSHEDQLRAVKEASAARERQARIGGF